MSISVMNWAWHQALKPVPKLVLMALADAADESGICWPSVSTVALKCNVSARTVRRSMQVLSADGLLVSEQRYRKDGSCSSNQYRLLLEGDDNLSPPPVSRDRIPGPGCQGVPDDVVIPVTTIGTIKESPLPLETASGSGTPESVVSGSGDLSVLEYPKGLSVAEQKEAKKKLVDLPSDLAQQLLDELAACIVAGSIRVSPLAYLRGLINRAQTNEFTPEAGLRIAEHRERRTKNEAALRRSSAAGRECLPADTPVADSMLAQKLTALRRRAQRTE